MLTPGRARKWIQSEASPVQRQVQRQPAGILQRVELVDEAEFVRRPRGEQQRRAVMPIR